MDPIQNIYEAVVGGKNEEVSAFVQAGLDAGYTPADILQKGFISAMAEVGRLYEEGISFVPEMMVSARAMKVGLEILKPFLADSGVESAGKVAVGTVQGDLHDIGKNLVAMMLEGAGFEIVDLGTDVPPEKLIASVREGVDVLALSSLLITTMPNMATSIKAIKDAGLRDRVKIIIGGAPITVEYANQIGADGYAQDASQAVNLTKSLMP